MRPLPRSVPFAIRTTKGSDADGEEDKGQAGPWAAGEGHDREGDTVDQTRLPEEHQARGGGRRQGWPDLGRRGGHARPRGVRPALPRTGGGAGRVCQARLGAGAPGAAARRGDAGAALGGASRRGCPRRAGPQEPRRALPGPRGLRRGQGRRQPPRAQARPGHGGGPGRHPHVAHGRGHGRVDEVPPVRRDPALLAARLRQGHAWHEAEYLARVPRARLGLLRGRGGEDRLRQPRDGRGQPSQGRRDSARRGLRGARGPPRDRDHAHGHAQAQAEGQRGGHLRQDRHGHGGEAAQPRPPRSRRARRGDTRGPRRDALPEEGGEAKRRCPGRPGARSWRRC